MVSFILKNPHFLLKNLHFLSKNLHFPIKESSSSIIKLQEGVADPTGGMDLHIFGSIDRCRSVSPVVSKTDEFCRDVP